MSSGFMDWITKASFSAWSSPTGLNFFIHGITSLTLVFMVGCMCYSWFGYVRKRQIEFDLRTFMCPFGLTGAFFYLFFVVSRLIIDIMSLNKSNQTTQFCQTAIWTAVSYWVGRGFMYLFAVMRLNEAFFGSTFGLSMVPLAMALLSGFGVMIASAVLALPEFTRYVQPLIVDGRVFCYAPGFSRGFLIMAGETVITSFLGMYFFFRFVQMLNQLTGQPDTPPQIKASYTRLKHRFMTLGVSTFVLEWVFLLIGVLGGYPQLTATVNCVMSTANVWLSGQIHEKYYKRICCMCFKYSEMSVRLIQVESSANHSRALSNLSIQHTKSGSNLGGSSLQMAQEPSFSPSRSGSRGNL